MFKQLIISNFQAHKDTVVDFDPHLTVLLGSSNAGKTAALRAIRWVSSNRPAGSSFIRNGSDLATIELKTDSAVIVRRKGRKGHNEYELDGEVLEAFGADVPEKVKDALNLAEVNTADQLDKHFLILDAPGAIARTLNEAVKLDRAEAAASAAASAARDCKKDAERKRGELAIAREQLARLSWVGDFRKDFNAASAALDTMSARVQRTDSLAGLVRSIQEVGEQVDACPDCSSLAEAAETALRAANVVEGMKARATSLSRLLDTVALTEQALSSSGLDPGLAAEYAAAVSLADDRRKKATRLNGLADIEDSVEALRKEEAVVSSVLDDLSKSEASAMADLTNCPYCGQLLGDDAREHLLEGRTVA